MGQHDVYHHVRIACLGAPLVWCASVLLLWLLGSNLEVKLLRYNIPPEVYICSMGLSAWRGGCGLGMEEARPNGKGRARGGWAGMGWAGTC